MMYKLTTPHMMGNDIKAAQKLLRKWYSGPIDGEYGPDTAAAVQQAKWDLGYAEKDVNGVYGTQLNAYLSGNPVSFLMKRRAENRAKQDKGETAIHIGRQFIGVAEQPPGSNEVMFSKWYGIIGPWCAMFVSYCFVEAKSKAFERGNHYSYCPFILADARAHKNNLTVVPSNNVRPGDIVLYDWQHDGTADHVGIVTSTVKRDGSFTAIEGNTSGTNPSDGGMVSEGPRSTADVIAFIRVLA